ncbi:MAG: hypothetical protein K2I93_04150 [Oscillospiraceae bacterium]|nr:hypothetical protein [Oscillospiraceae bacterium]
MRKSDPDILPDMDADDLVALLDSLFSSGSQHIQLNIGDETKVQTMNSTDCCTGACAIPTLGDEPDEDEF